MKTLSLFSLSCFSVFLFTGCNHTDWAYDSPRFDRSGFNGKNLDGWSAPHGNWTVVKSIALDSANPAIFAYTPGSGLLVNGTDEPTSNLVSEFTHGDVEVHIEFNVPKGSNSGVYLMGRYEVQVLDSWGVENPTYTDVGGIYHRWADGKGYEGSDPIVNASKAPGEWQSFDIVFRAPRFDEAGNKTANARFLSVKLNGVLVQENFETTGPTRSAHIEEGEAAWGPLMLQGDHGPVAYRNIRLHDIDLN